MSDLDLGALFGNMGKILLAVLTFIISFIPIGAFAFISAYLVSSDDRAHFFERKAPKQDTITGFLVFLGGLHCAVTFFLALLWGTEGSSAVLVITYSVAVVITVMLGLGLGGLILGIMWYNFQKYVLKTDPEAGKAQSGEYQPVASGNEHELESGTQDSQEADEPTTEPTTESTKV
ncbi:hypothetical protein PRZ48_007173 [Zasmidium cellare]|uniref:DUF4870 domain-containing protein n=1 Tax=Zasmidium cellare TaxID=395010 RepID=A0ABR0EIP5_ZASCE|nr:hypothetical protein PRZ48_007173 [Zasmidium cellare]